MTVGELIIQLTRLPKDNEVIIQKDGGGNSYSPLSCVDGEAIYIPDSTWSGEVYSLNWSAEDADMSPDDWQDFCDNNPKCVVLAPVS